jgi:hypothetical protein
MNIPRTVQIVSVVGVVLFCLPHAILAKDPGTSFADYCFVESGPVEQSTLYADGSVIELHTKKVWWPMSGSDLSYMTPDEFKRMAIEGWKAAQANPNVVVVSPDGPLRGPNFVYNVINGPTEAVEALDSVASYLERTFDDDITVTITVQFVPLPEGVIGQCMSYYAGPVSWTNTRNGLISDMDADDSLQNWLPSGSTIPVRYDYYSSSVTNVENIDFTKANYKAAIGSVSGNDAFMQYNTDFIFDFDPSDGITAMCFQSVAVHETGHCMGFTSAADGGIGMEALDIYRFQYTDDTGDYNPDNLSEFQTTARLVDSDDGSLLTDDVISDLVSIEYQMSDGTPYQCSHFSQDNVYAIMQPATSSGETFYPHFLKIPDRLMFDAIGWDYLLDYAMTLNVIGNGLVDVDPEQWTYQAGTEVVLHAIADSLWEFDHWSGDLEGSQNPDTIIMDDDYIIYAHFRSLYYTLTITVDGSGSVNKNPDEPLYSPGTPVELTAIPDQGWNFDHWSGNLWGSQNPDTITMNGNRTVTAHFMSQYITENQTGGVDAPFVTIFPNPSYDFVTITYGMGQYNEAGRIEIYDVTGQLVKDFSPLTVPTQNHAFLVWDGRSNTGSDLPNGIYFVRFNVAGYQETQKLLLVK